MNIQYAHEFTIMLLPSVLFASAMFGIIHVSAFSKPQT